MEKGRPGHHKMKDLLKRTLTATAFLMCSTVLAASVNTLAYSGPAWSPYLVGALIGVLVWFTFLLADKPLGASSGYVTMAADLGRWLAPNHTGKLEYFKDKPLISWTLVFVIGIVGGSFLAAFSGGELTGRFLHPMWIERFGEQSGWLRAGVSLVGGICLAFGARLAGGCTSGHGISGTLQLSAGSWVSLICFFIGGMGAAFLLYG